MSLAELIVAKGLSVREAEAAARAAKNRPKAAKRPKTLSKDADTRELEGSVSAALGLAVSIDHKGDAGGEVRVKYKTLEQLDEICRRLSLAV